MRAGYVHADDARAEAGVAAEFVLHGCRAERYPFPHQVEHLRVHRREALRDVDASRAGARDVWTGGADTLQRWMLPEVFDVVGLFECARRMHVEEACPEDRGHGQFLAAEVSHTPQRLQTVVFRSATTSVSCAVWSGGSATGEWPLNAFSAASSMDAVPGITQETSG